MSRILSYSFRRAIAIVLCVSGGSLLADQVVLKNGDRLTGKILTTDDKTLTMKTDFVGEVKIDRTAITSISSDEALNVTPKQGDKVVGKIATSDGALDVQPAQGSARTIKLDALDAVRNDEEQHKWEREQERLVHPRLDDFWAGSIAFNLANAAGNAKTTALGTTAAATRVAGKNKMTLYFNQVYASQSTTTPFGTTANRVSGGFRIDRDISKKLFVFGTADFDYDQFLSLDLRSAIGGGLGYHIIRSDKGYWDVGVGAVWTREKYSTPITLDPLEYVRNSAELLISEESAYQVFSKVKWFQRLAFYPNASDAGEFRINFDTNASVPVLKFMEWTIGFSDRYLSNPPLLRKKNDTLLTTGIRLSFDQTKR
jgi:putative salt-induced outer membrane protein